MDQLLRGISQEVAIGNPHDGREVCVKINEPIGVHVSGRSLRRQDTVCGQLERRYDYTAEDYCKDKTRRADIQFRKSVLLVLDLQI